MIIRVECNDERGRGVAREYDARPSYDENVTKTQGERERGVHRAEDLCRCLQQQSTWGNKMGRKLIY